MNVNLVIGDADAFFVKSKFNLLLHIIENIPVIVAVNPNETSNID